MLDLSEQSALEILDRYALRDSVKATFLYMACQWGISPAESGMGFMVPLLVDRGLQKAFIYGGSHRLASAFARVILRQGGIILDNAEVVQILTDGSRASGVLLEDGREIRARKAVLSSLDPQSTFLHLLPAEAAPEDLRASARELELGQVVAALRLLRDEGQADMAGEPRQPDDRDADPFATILGFDGSDDVVRFLDGVERGEVPKFAGHFTCESAFDPALSQKEGEHVSFFQMPAPYDYPWDERHDDVVRQVTDLLDAHYEGFRDSVLQVVVESPKAIEQRMPNMVRGSIKHGDYNPIQMGNNRPNADCSSSRTPVKGLYLCGASLFPGGMVIGGPGYTAAQIVCADNDTKFPFAYPDRVLRYLDTYFPDGKDDVLRG